MLKNAKFTFASLSDCTEVNTKRLAMYFGNFAFPSSVAMNQIGRYISNNIIFFKKRGSPKLNALMGYINLFIYLFIYLYNK